MALLAICADAVISRLGVLHGNADAGSELGMLRGHRLAAGLTQEELAERSGLSVRAISNIERGRTTGPYSRSVRMLAEAWGLPDHARAAAAGVPGRPERSAAGQPRQHAWTW